jgi:hypothetical protein
MNKAKDKYQNHRKQLAFLEKRDLLTAWIGLGIPTDRDFYECFRHVWIHSEGASNNKSLWLMMMESPRPGKEKWLMTREELAHFESLPDTVTIYRGSSTNKINGLSWTTDKDKAIWFGNRFNFGASQPPFNKECCLTTGQIAKADIFAVFLERRESEIVCDPKHVKRKTKEILPPKKS